MDARSKQVWGQQLKKAACGSAKAWRRTGAHCSYKYLNRICMQPSRTMPKKFSTWCSQRITNRRK
jgi:hypothetical protein